MFLMDDNNAIVSADIEITVLEDSEDTLSAVNMKKIDCSDFASLGLSADLINQLKQVYDMPGGEGIYRVTFKNGFNGHLSKFKNENAYLGSGISNGQMAQARLTQIPFDPEKLFMGLMLLDLERKTSQILALEQEILDTIYVIQESKYMGYSNDLTSIIEDYYNNWQSPDFINQKLSVIGNIKSESEGGRAFYKKEIERIIQAPFVPEFIAGANRKVSKLHNFIDGYRLAFYDSVMSIYIETLLIKNFSSENLNTIYERLKSIAKDYDSLLSQCQKWEEKILSNSIGHIAIAPILRNLDKGVGTVVSKLTPWEFEKHYNSDAEYYVSPDVQRKRLEERSDNGIQPIMSSIETIDDLHNHEQSLFIKSNDVYLLEKGEPEKGA